MTKKAKEVLNDKDVDNSQVVTASEVIPLDVIDAIPLNQSNNKNEVGNSILNVYFLYVRLFSIKTIIIAKIKFPAQPLIKYLG